MRTLSDLCQEAEDYFHQMELDFDATQNAYQHILATIDKALLKRRYSALYELISYIEDGEGHLAFQYIGKTHRILRMLNIITLENKYQKKLFCNDCDSVKSLWGKYMLTLFAFRRLHFRLSEESTDEAVVYLQNHPISHFAAYMMTQDELIIPDQAFYETLALIYAQDWSPADMQQFFALTSSCRPVSEP